VIKTHLSFSRDAMPQEIPQSASGGEQKYEGSTHTENNHVK
jgi:hypothetical protein